MQYQKVVRKVLVELATDKPDLSYIRGLLEGLVDDETVPERVYKTIDKVLETNIKSDEETEIPAPAFTRPGPMGKLNS